MPVDYPDWTRALLLLGQIAGGEYTPLLVDSTGQLVALLQGQIDSIKTTISVDANGRIECFVLDDESQWGDIIKVGNAELAARLGSATAWDWRGKVLHSTIFADGYGGWRPVSGGTGGSITLVPDYALSGGFAAKMVARTDSTYLAYLTLMMHTPASDVVGLSCVWRGRPLFSYFHVDVAAYRSEVLYQARIRYSTADARYEYLDSGDTYQELYDYDFYDDVWEVHHSKIVADFANGVYVRFLADGHQVDMSQALRVDSTPDEKDRTYFMARLYGDASANREIYVDSLIATVAEPVS